MIDLDVNLAESTAIQFEVRSCSDASLLLLQDESDNGTQLYYELVIGKYDKHIWFAQWET